MKLEQLENSYTLLVQRVIKLENEKEKQDNLNKKGFDMVISMGNRISELEHAREIQIKLNSTYIDRLELEKAINQVRKKIYKPSLFDKWFRQHDRE